jgi:hypothetical protein
MYLYLAVLPNFPPFDCFPTIYNKHHNRPILIVVETIVKDAAAAVEVAEDAVKVAVKVAVKAVVDAVKAVAADVVDAVKAVAADVVAMAVVADEVVAVVVQARRLASTSKIQTPFRHCRYGDMTGI